jgi:protein-tyrosine phosphatase
VRRGTLVQVTASSLATPAKAARSARFARWIVVQGLAHVIASDSHGPHARRAPLSVGREQARALVGARADWMVEDAPAALLAGDPLPSPPPLSERPRGLFARLRR